MALRVLEIRDDSAYGPRDSLFGDIRSFRFTPVRGGFLRTLSLQLGAIRVAEVSSAGHDIALGAVGGVTFLAPQSGRIAVQTPCTRLDARPGGALIIGPGERETFVRREERADFRAMVVIAPAEDGAKRTRAAGAAVDSPSARSLSGFLRYLLGEVAEPDSPLLRPRALRAAEALLRDSLGAVDGVDAPVAAAEADGVAQRRIRAAEDYMRAHADAPLTVEAVARAVGVGPRALHAAFRDRLGTTPRALLAEIRLERARARLLAPGPETTVTDAAMESGFAHLGRFALYYRRRFGESPSKTLRKARGEA
ncbi:helix-turn-helix transcriptional regulator [Rubrimonas cliftonensis]|uniref:Transcriptional regulator, AraC family n=1 Tax=Rubrimonas cliftonensis TaxID=89524 RepID=A0A1H4FQQ1_9RHOB|nr:helix-turn-helix transcriptional regulator [Rubrimonas cliftonensis]SEA99150.1 transcriptional regulator, AraC family [Rubrimonas cliftonensis]